MDACSCSGSHWTSLLPGEATRRSFDQTSPGPLETPTVNEPTPDTTVATDTDNAINPSPSDTSGLSKTYPKRQRKQPDWFCNY